MGNNSTRQHCPQKAVVVHAAMAASKGELRSNFSTNWDSILTLIGGLGGCFKCPGARLQIPLSTLMSMLGFYPWKLINRTHLVRGHPVSHDNRPHIEMFQSVHPCSDDAIITSHNRPHIETSWSAPFCRDNGAVTSHNRPHIETFWSAGPYIPPHHCPTFASRVRLRIEIFQSAGPHTPS